MINWCLTGIIKQTYNSFLAKRNLTLIARNEGNDCRVCGLKTKTVLKVSLGDRQISLAIWVCPYN